MWYASILDSPRLVFTWRPSFIANIEVVCIYLRRACYISSFQHLVTIPIIRVRGFRLLPSSHT